MRHMVATGPSTAFCQCEQEADTKLTERRAKAPSPQLGRARQAAPVRPGNQMGHPGHMAATHAGADAVAQPNRVCTQAP